MKLDYWSKRTAKAQDALTRKNVKEVEKQLSKYYSQTMRNCISQFEATYNKLLATVEKGKEPTPADLYKLDTYWQLQNQLRQELLKLGNRQEALYSRAFVEQFQSIYNALAMPSDDSFSTLALDTVEQMIREIWCADGQSWSSRIWKNTDILAGELNDSLIDCVLAGKTTRQLKNILQERFGVSYNRADALVRTEMAHIQTQSAQKRYEDYGIKQVEVFVDEDEKTCPICSKHEGERFFITEKMPIPFHPRCRCCVIPVIEGLDTN